MVATEAELTPVTAPKPAEAMTAVIAMPPGSRPNHRRTASNRSSAMRR